MSKLVMDDEVSILPNVSAAKNFVLSASRLMTAKEVKVICADIRMDMQLINRLDISAEISRRKFKNLF